MPFVGKYATPYLEMRSVLSRYLAYLSGILALLALLPDDLARLALLSERLTCTLRDRNALFRGMLA